MIKYVAYTSGWNSFVEPGNSGWDVKYKDIIESIEFEKETSDKVSYKRSWYLKKCRDHCIFDTLKDAADYLILKLITKKDGIKEELEEIELKISKLKGV